MNTARGRGTFARFKTFVPASTNDAMITDTKTTMMKLRRFHAIKIPAIMNSIVQSVFGLI